MYKVINVKHDGLEANISIPNEEYGLCFGSYEYWDIKTNGYSLYEEGQLIFEDGVLIDYDGVFVLPDFILNAISKDKKVELWNY